MEISIKWFALCRSGEKDSTWLKRKSINLLSNFRAGGDKISDVSRFKGILSLISGITGVLVSLSFWLGAGSLFSTSFAIPFSIVGIILARSRLKESEDAIAKTGLTVSVFAFLLNVATLIAFLIFFR